MNKKQLTVAWVMGIVIVAIFLITPKIAYYKDSYINYNDIFDIKPYTEVLHSVAPLINWSVISGYLLILVIFGGLLIYTLRDKK